LDETEESEDVGAFRRWPRRRVRGLDGQRRH